jgi:hypothetical protein
MGFLIDAVVRRIGQTLASTDDALLQMQIWLRFIVRTY